MRVLLACLVLLATVSCNDSAAEPLAPATNRVLIEATTFTPPTVNVRVGGTIEFAFGGTPHNVIFEDAPGRPENIESMLTNTVEQRVFSVAGTFPYSCQGTDHPAMNGRIIVVPLASTDEE